MTVTIESHPANYTLSQPSRRLRSELGIDGPLESLGLVLDLVNHPMLICCLCSQRIVAANSPAHRLAADRAHFSSGQHLWLWSEAAFGKENADLLKQTLSPGSTCGLPCQRITARDGRQFRWQWRALSDSDAESRLAVLAFYECSGPTDSAAWLQVYGQDELTGLANRAGLFHWREENAERIGDGSWCAVFFLDLDNFKAVNDQFGHLAGDRVLRAVARRLAGSLRPSDLVVRYGGDEFVAVVAGIETPHEADRIAARIVAALDEPIELDDRPGSPAQEEQARIVVGVSLGVALAQGKFNFERLLDDADRSMYRAKARSRGSPAR